MPAIISPPTILNNAMNQFIDDYFQNKPQRNHCANYLTDRMLAQSKTVAGITAGIVQASDQSCLNRFMTKVQWDHEELNVARINRLQQFDDTRFHADGIIALEDVLIELCLLKYAGRHIEYLGFLYDHAQKRTYLAHDLIFVNYGLVNK